MKAFFVISAAFIACCYGLPTGGVKNDLDVSNYIAIPVDKFKKMMKEGDDKLGLPVLDPFAIDEQALNLNKPDLISVEGLIKNFKLDGLSAFDAIKADFNIVGLKLGLQLVFKQLQLESDYNVKGMLIDLAPIYGQGHVSAIANNLNVSCDLKIGMLDGKIQVKSLQTAVHLDSLQLTVTGLYYDDEMSDLISQLVSDMVPQLIEDYQIPLTNEVNKIATDKLNGFLATKSLKDLLDLLS